MSTHPAVLDPKNRKDSYAKANIKSCSKAKADASGRSREYVGQLSIFASDLISHILLVADVLRVLPHVPQPLAPEMLLNLSDYCQVTTTVSPHVPATPPLLGLLYLSIPGQSLIIMNIGSVGSSASSSPSSNPLGDSYRSSASSSSVQSNQISFRLLEAGDWHVSIPGDAEIAVSPPGSEQENVCPNPGLGPPDRSVTSLSRKRMAPNSPGLRFQVDLFPGTEFSFTNSGYDFEASTMSVETGPLPLAGNQFPHLSCHGQSVDPITPVDQIIHTPDLPPQVLRCDKRSTYQPRSDEIDDFFSQSVDCVPSSSPYDHYLSSHWFAAAEYGSSKPSPFHTSRAQNYSFPSSPLASFHAGVQSASSCLLPLGPEDYPDAQTQDIAHLADLPRRLSYPCDTQLPDSGLSRRMTSAAYSCASEENNVANSPGSLELASPAVIRPFFTPDFSYLGSGSLPHTPLGELETASINDGPVSQ